MSREIKFRAWDTVSMGESFNPLDNQFMAEGGTFPSKTIFMQFTGFRDWFDGDIIEYLAGEQGADKTLYKYRGVINFNQGSFYISSRNSLRSEILLSEIDGANQYLWHWQGSHAGKSAYYICSGFIKIGNIYENPELLKP